MKKFDRSEEKHQEAVFAWAEIMMRRRPELKDLEGSMNGIKLFSHGQIKKIKRLGGLKKGRPDIHLPVPRGGYAALFIELKKVYGGRESDDQKEYGKRLKSYGNYYAVCNGSDEAISMIIKYLDERLEDPEASIVWFQKERRKQ